MLYKVHVLHVYCCVSLLCENIFQYSSQRWRKWFPVELWHWDEIYERNLYGLVSRFSHPLAKLMHNVQQGGRSLLHRFKSFMFTVVLFFWVFFQSKFVICSFLEFPFVPLVTELFVKIKGLKSNKALFSGSYCLLQKHLLAVRMFLPFLIYVTTVCNTLAQSSPSLSFGTPSNRE